MVRLLVNIDVDDLERGIAFYSSALALRVGRRLGPTVVELLGAAVPIYLLEKSAGSIPHVEGVRARDYARHWTPVHLDFVVEDLEGALELALRCGARAEGPIGAYDWGRMVLLSDPFGHGMCLLEFTGEGYG